MAEKEESIPINMNMETQDPSIDRRHAAMLSRLNRLHQSRTATDAGDTTTADSTSSFLSQFSATKNSIRHSLSQLPLSQNPNPKPALQTLSQQISSLETEVAQHSYLLPSYELRSSLKSIHDLKQSLETLTSQLVPRQRFSFKSKRTNNNNNATLPNPIDDLKHNNYNGEGEIVGVLLNNPVRDSPGFKGRENEVLVKEFREGDGEGEFILSGLSNCEVRLSGCLRALFVHKLRGCRVYVGAVYGSVLIEEVEGCVFVMASHQIRIHFGKGTDFYLRVRSRPIIEDCSGVRFAPYCLRYEGIESDLEKANLDEETGNWANVDDFRWLRAVQSPNWSVLPECERIGSVMISDSEA